MIPRNAVPTSHITPRPPIDINPRVPVTIDFSWPVIPLCPVEIARLWGLVRGAAEGSNITAAPIAEVVEC